MIEIKKIKGVRWIDDEEMKEILDIHCQDLLGISGKQFIKNRNSGKYDRVNCAKQPEIVFLCMLAPSRVRRER